jgi:hypothetical protein
MCLKSFVAKIGMRIDTLDFHFPMAVRAIRQNCRPVRRFFGLHVVSFESRAATGRVRKAHITTKCAVVGDCARAEHRQADIESNIAAKLIVISFMADLAF